MQVIENKCSLLEKQVEDMQSDHKAKLKKLNSKVEKLEAEVIA